MQDWVLKIHMKEVTLVKSLIIVNIAIKNLLNAVLKMSMKELTQVKDPIPANFVTKILCR